MELEWRSSRRVRSQLRPQCTHRRQGVPKLPQLHSRRLLHHRPDHSTTAQLHVQQHFSWPSVPTNVLLLVPSNDKWMIQFIFGNTKWDQTTGVNPALRPVRRTLHSRLLSLSLIHGAMTGHTLAPSLPGRQFTLALILEKMTPHLLSFIDFKDGFTDSCLKWATQQLILLPWRQWYR